MTLGSRGVVGSEDLKGNCIKCRQKKDRIMNNLYRVRKTFFGRCILQCYHKAENPENCGWFDVPYHKAPTSLREYYISKDAVSNADETCEI